MCGSRDVAWSAPQPTAAAGRGPADDSSGGGRARLLMATGTVGFLAGAVLVIWPLWAAGLALVAASLLVYRP